jgi:hypothetical protein
VTEVSSGNRVNLGVAQPRLRLQSRFNERLNEVFFANCVVLVEAEPDEIACKCALERQGMELDRASISVVAVGGVTEVPIVAELLVGFGIPAMALVDEDPGNAATAAVRGRITQVVGAANVFLQAPNLETVFGMPHKPSRVGAMTAFPAWFANPANPMPTAYSNLAVRIRQVL